MQINQRLDQYLSAEAELGRVGKKHLAGAVNLLISMLTISLSEKASERVTQGTHHIHGDHQQLPNSVRELFW